MSKLIDFYFDFISPYSYLAHKKIINSSDRNKFNYKAILLGGLHNLGGITAPAFNKKKMKKGRFFLFHCSGNQSSEALPSSRKRRTTSSCSSLLANLIASLSMAVGSTPGCLSNILTISACPLRLAYRIA